MSSDGSSSATPPTSQSHLPAQLPAVLTPQSSEPEWTAANASFGPNVFNRTREQWVRGELRGFGASAGRATAKPAKRSDPSADALRKLDEVLNMPGVDEDTDVWKHYLQDVHGRLVGGNKVKKGLRLSQAVKILRIGWVRDGTWFGDEQASTTGTIASPPPTDLKMSGRSPATKTGRWGGGFGFGSGRNTASSTTPSELPVIR